MRPELLTLLTIAALLLGFILFYKSGTTEKYRGRYRRRRRFGFPYGRSYPWRYGYPWGLSSYGIYGPIYSYSRPVVNYRCYRPKEDEVCKIGETRMIGNRCCKKEIVYV